MIHAYPKEEFNVELYNDLIRQVKIVSNLEHVNIKSFKFKDDTIFYYLIYEDYSSITLLDYLKEKGDYSQEYN